MREERKEKERRRWTGRELEVRCTPFSRPPAPPRASARSSGGARAQGPGTPGSASRTCHSGECRLCSAANQTDQASTSGEKGEWWVDRKLVRTYIKRAGGTHPRVSRRIGSFRGVRVRRVTHFTAARAGLVLNNTAQNSTAQHSIGIAQRCTRTKQGRATQHIPRWCTPHSSTRPVWQRPLQPQEQPPPPPPHRRPASSGFSAHSRWPPPAH